ncbi:hypothetical protein [Massilia putida]|uniref:hypothetical protein n=1 Tax=Massilia putida TaxID=1141883 RepID=UPI000952E18A|nr:hypothetical protein [Massilia putida]
MSTDFASLSYSFRVVSQQRDIAIKLGHAQQLLACAFGYQTLAGYQRSSEEPATINDGVHLVLDAATLRQRATDLGLSLTSKQLVDLIDAAFASRLRRSGVHASEMDFFDFLHGSLQSTVVNDDDVGRITADMNTNGVREIYVPFDFTLADLPEVGETLSIPVVGHLSMEIDLERPYAGHQVDVEAIVSVDRLGRRLVGNVHMEIERASENAPYADRALISRAQAYADRLDMPLELMEQLDNVLVDENAGTSGDGAYGYWLDFSAADPQHVVAAILQKHGTLLFDVGPSFFEDVERED